ncbi:MAG TPA: SEC-C domain-containing protein [Methylomirabilota bacterium]|nr:SEC-C domain-containing protein [Methylomirabilota bacterium]
MIETPDPRVPLASPCPCGSGRKYKRCCWPVEKQRAAEARAAVRSSTGEVAAYALRFKDEIEEFEQWFFGPARERIAEDDLDELLSQVGDAIHVAFMDMLVSDYVTLSGETLIERFLDDDAASGDLHPAAREYLARWNEAAMGLYEVQEVVPGESLVLKDLFTRRSVSVAERTASLTVDRWDVVFTRVVQLGEVGLITGPVLPVPRRKLQWVMENVQRLKEQPGDRTVTWSRYFKKHWNDVPYMWFLMWAAPLKGLQLRNSDDEELLHITVTLGLRAGGGPRAAELLDSIEELERAAGGGWSWLESRDRGTLETISIAHIGLEGDSVEVLVNSREREARVRERVEGVLGELVASVERTEEAPDLEGMKERATSGNLDDDRGDLPFEVQQRVVHEMLTKHYRSWLDEPIPALDGLTPRQAVADRDRRQQVISLLKGIEVDAHRRGPDDPMHGFDFAWLWRELGLRR